MGRVGNSQIYDLKLLALLVWLSILLSGPSLWAEEKDPAAVPRRSPTLSVALSGVFPGGGQLYTGNYLKAAAFAAGLGYIGYHYRQEDLAAKRAPNAYEWWDHDWERRKYKWWFIGVWLVSLADAYVDAHLYKFDDQAEPEAGLQAGPGYAALIWRF
jgi:hypothetical protein